MLEFNNFYSEQLKHSLWKEKRNSILLERGSKCERCGDTNHLQVHHKKYIKDRAKIYEEKRNFR